VANGAETSVVKFGLFEVDPRAGELRRNGVKVKLQDQPFQVLAMLLERPGEVVSREELQRRLWPADTFVDFDHSLNAAVKRLRDALGDSADNPRFVETLAKRGYRFLAPVAGIDGNSANGHAAKAAEIPGKRKSHRWQVALAALLAAACISVGWHIGHRATSPVLPREVRVTANSPDAPVYFAAISADGRYLAYTDPRGVFVREIATEESHKLSLPEGLRVQTASWYPDGSHLLAQAMTEDEENWSLWNIPVLGGAPRRLADNAVGARVSPDGKQISFVRGDGKNFNHSEIWLTGTDGGQPRIAVNVPGFVVGPPAWSPDGTRLAYLKDVYWPGYEKEDVSIETFDLASGKTETVLADYKLRYGLAWTRDGRILFSQAEAPPNQGESNIWSVRVDRAGRRAGDPVRLTDGPDWKPVINASEDGKRVLFIRTNIVPTIYAADVDARKRQIGKLQRLTLDERQNRPYEWTADGKSVLYLSNREDGSRIYRQELGAATPEQIPGVRSSPNILRLNPEGTEILYTAEIATDLDQSGNGPGAKDASSTTTNGSKRGDIAAPFDARTVRIMRIPAGGGTEQVLLEASGINNFQCARAPAQECVFSQFTKDGLSFVEFDARAGEKKKQLLRIAEPEWQYYNWSLSPDGRMLALAKEHRAAETEVRLVPTQGGAERVLRVKDWQGVTTLDWAADGKSLWASALLRGEARALINIDLRGKAKVVLQESKPYVGWAIPSRDGKKLAMWESAGGSNAWMLEGF
jgi:DNA-binding winged helix-turn-helix (wHTH) protein/Tol biopolymer transport system component